MDNNHPCCTHNSWEIFIYPCTAMHCTVLHRTEPHFNAQHALYTGPHFSTTLHRVKRKRKKFSLHSSGQRHTIWCVKECILLFDCTEHTFVHNTRILCLDLPGHGHSSPIPAGNYLLHYSAAALLGKENKVTVFGSRHFPKYHHGLGPLWYAS